MMVMMTFSSLLGRAEERISRRVDLSMATKRFCCHSQSRRRRPSAIASARLLGHGVISFAAAAAYSIRFGSVSLCSVLFCWLQSISARQLRLLPIEKVGQRDGKDTKVAPTLDRSHSFLSDISSSAGRCQAVDVCCWHDESNNNNNTNNQRKRSRLSRR